VASSALCVVFPILIKLAMPCVERSMCSYHGEVKCNASEIESSHGYCFIDRFLSPTDRRGDGSGTEYVFASWKHLKYGDPKTSSGLVFLHLGISLQYDFFGKTTLTITNSTLFLLLLALSLDDQ
jgi:hypothetical protein